VINSRHFLIDTQGATHEIPHSPAIFLADGTADSMRATYDTQLRYTDKVLGTFLETMKATGSYDSSWIILTSDHGHHGFDLTPEQHRHVPFIVKPPGSGHGQIVHGRMQLWDLGAFFQALFSGADVDDALANIVPLASPSANPGMVLESQVGE